MKEADATLAARQRGLLALLKMRQAGAETLDAYLREVASSPGLEALRGIDYFWKEYSFLSRCPFTAGLMRRQGVLRDEVTRLIREERLSAFIEEMARLFLERASRHPDPLVATLARFERALAATAEGDPAEYRVEWDQDPYYILGCLLDDQPIDRDRARGAFVTVVSSAIEGRFRVDARSPFQAGTLSPGG